MDGLLCYDYCCSSSLLLVVITSSASNLIISTSGVVYFSIYITSVKVILYCFLFIRLINIGTIKYIPLCAANKDSTFGKYTANSYITARPSIFG